MANQPATSANRPNDLLLTLKVNTPQTLFPRPDHGNPLQAARLDINASTQAINHLLHPAPRLHRSLFSLIYREFQFSMDPDDTCLVFGHHEPYTTLSVTELAVGLYCAQSFDERALQPFFHYRRDPHRIRGVRFTPHTILTRAKSLDIAQALQESYDDYWGARATGSALSNREKIIELRQHYYSARARLAYCLYSLNQIGLEMANAIVDHPTASERESIEGSTTKHLRASSITFEEIASRNATIIDAFVIYSLDAPAGTQVAFIPGLGNEFFQFTSRTALETMLSERKAELQVKRTTVLPQDAKSVTGFTYIPLTGNPLGLLSVATPEPLLHEMKSCRLDPQSLLDNPARLLDAATQLESAQRELYLSSLSPEVEQSIDKTLKSEQQQALNPLTFGSLPPNLPILYQSQLVEEQEQSIRAFLGEDDSDNPTEQPLFVRLKQMIQRHRDAQKNTQRVIDNVLASPDDKDSRFWASDNRFSTLKHARREGLLAEATLQQALGSLSDSAFALLKALFDPPQESPAYRLAELAIGTEGRHCTLAGALLISSDTALQDPASERPALIYLPGEHGGLQSFNSLTELIKTVWRSLERMDEDLLLRHLKPEEQSDALDFIRSTGGTIPLHVKTISGDGFEHSLQAQIDLDASLAQRIDRDTASPEEKRQQQEQLNRQTAQNLGVNIHEARDMAMDNTIQQALSRSFAKYLPQWLTQAPLTTRTQLAAELRGLADAQVAVQKLLDRDLPEPAEFVRALLAPHINNDALPPISANQIRIEIPELVEMRTEHGRGPGPRPSIKIVEYVSPRRITLSLTELALLNIDDAMQLRLKHARSYLQADTGTALADYGFSVEKINRLIPTLNVASRYSQAITLAYDGASTENAMAIAYRRELLATAYAWEFALHCRIATRQPFTALGLQMLQATCQPDALGGVKHEGIDIELYQAIVLKNLIVLRNILFIHDKRSRHTLLYLPKAPNQKFITEHRDLLAAQHALEKMLGEEGMIDYLKAQGATQDQTSISRSIDSASKRDFSLLIKHTRDPLPASTSLAYAMVDFEKQRLLDEHQSSSTTTDAIEQERKKQKTLRIIGYVKALFGFVPVVGTAISLYDTVTGIIAANKAFKENNGNEGLAHAVDVIGSITDLLISAIPGNKALSGKTALSRTRLRQTQLRGLSKNLRRPSLRRKITGFEETRPDPFQGYEIGRYLPGTAVAAHGRYAGVIRHPEGHFIQRNGITYAVQWDAYKHTWRLCKTARKTYLQPVAYLNGEWQTHGQASGHLVIGSGLGGGPKKQTIAQLKAEKKAQLEILLNEYAAFEPRFKRTQAAIAESADIYQMARPEQRAAARKVYQHRLKEMIETYDQTRTRLDKIHDLDKTLLDYEKKSADLRHDVIVSTRKLRDLQSADYRDMIHPDATIHAAIARVARLMENGDTSGLTTLEAKLNKTIDISDEIIQWHEFEEAQLARLKATGGPGRTLFTELMSKETPISSSVLYNKLGQLTLLLPLSIKRSEFHKSTLHHTIQDLQEINTSIHLTLNTHLEAKLGPHLSAHDRLESLNSCAVHYETYAFNYNVVKELYPDALATRFVDKIIDRLNDLKKSSEADIQALTRELESGFDAPPKLVTATPARKLFKTRRSGVLIGRSRHTQAQTEVMDVMDPASDNVIGTFIRDTDDQWMPLAPAQPPSESLKKLTSDAQQLLQEAPRYRAKAEYFDRQAQTSSTLPSDVEDMLVRFADRLKESAAKIRTASQGGERTDVHNDLNSQLETQADALTTFGQQTRISMTQAQPPTIDRLKYLVAKGAVTLHKAPLRKQIGSKKKPDFLQVYDIRDSHNALLWSAHFHYAKAQGPVDAFTAAHLKTAEQNRSGLETQMAQASLGETVTPILRAPIDAQSARTLFAPLDT